MEKEVTYSFLHLVNAPRELTTYQVLDSMEYWLRTRWDVEKDLRLRSAMYQLCDSRRVREAG